MAQSTLARLRPRRWKTETWVCSMRGHVVPAAGVQRLRPGTGDDRLALETPNGRLGRCLRCDLWVAIDRPGTEAPEVLGADDTLPRPRRASELDQSLVIRIIAIERAFHVVAYLTVAVVAVFLWADFGAVHHWATDLVHSLSPAGHPLLSSNLSRLSHLKVGTLEIVVGAALWPTPCSRRSRRWDVARAPLGRVPDRGGHGRLHPGRDRRARRARGPGCGWRRW